MVDNSAAIAEVIRRRRTIHDFREELPPRELIVQAIDLARWAPNHKHTEPWRFHLLGPQTVSTIVELNAELASQKKGAAAGVAKRERWSKVPGWIAVTCAESADTVRRDEDYAACCCAIHNASLFLWSHGVGVKWSTGDVTRCDDFYKLLEIDRRERRVVALLWYGYPAHTPEQRRKPVEDIVVELP